MKVTKGELDGILIIEPKIFSDSRGFFLETWNERRYGEAGIDLRFVQDNLSSSSKGVLRGLHFQNPNPQGKLVSVLAGEVFDVVVDLRRTSQTFKRWWGTNLSSSNARQLYIPPGFAHGFLALTETVFSYKCTQIYDPPSEVTLLWNDPEIGIKWPITEPVVSEKDRKGLKVSEMLPGILF